MRGIVAGMIKRRNGFSLIELLMVLGVMAILMGMLVPSVGVIRGKAQRMATAQKLRQIGLAVATYQSVTGRSLAGSDIGAWIAELAAETGVREGKLFIFEEDPLLAEAGGLIPPVLVQKGAGGNWEEVEGFEDWPIGVAVVSGLPPGAHPSTTPVAWTRGLTAAGQWQAFDGKRPGIYGTEGGYIVFLDGHVEFFRDLSRDGGRLVDFANGQPTSDIRKAIGPGAAVHDFLGKVF
jgi:prepilin-type N-terminal cleavage/methylation domain-containing protein/prepilin-type processing-associated H-X9-DG protein